MVVMRSLAHNPHNRFTDHMRRDSQGFKRVTIYYDMMDGLTLLRDFEVSGDKNIVASYNAALTAKYAF